MKVLVEGKDGFNPYRDMPTVVAFDYDGVIVDANGDIVTEAIKSMVMFSQMGIKIVIWTCRDPNTIAHVEQAFKSMGIDIIGINKDHPQIEEAYEVVTRKVFAHKYIDDQSVGWSRLNWEDIRQEIVFYQVQRMLKGEIDLKGYPVNLNSEIKHYQKVLSDFNIEVSEEEIESWETMTPIQIGNRVKALIKKKLGDK